MERRAIYANHSVWIMTETLVHQTTVNSAGGFLSAASVYVSTCPEFLWLAPGQEIRIVAQPADEHGVSLVQVWRRQE